MKETNQLIPIGKLGLWKDNPRLQRDEGIGELIESIREKGILTPLKVRPVGKQEGVRASDSKTVTEDHYQVITGNRRYQAAVKLALAEVPCIVKEMTDAEAREESLTEQIQREDLSPYEEARVLGGMAKAGLPVEDLAKKIGKSPGFIRSRLKLLDLGEKALAIFHERKLPLSAAANALALEDPALREKYLKTLRFDQEAYSSVRDDFTELREAHFDLKDKALPPRSCEGCPDRSTVGAKDLFGEAGVQGDYCLAAKCFQEKQAAWVKKQLEKQGFPITTRLADRYFSSYSSPKATQDCKSIIAKAEYKKFTVFCVGGSACKQKHPDRVRSANAGPARAKGSGKSEERGKREAHATYLLLQDTMEKAIKPEHVRELTLRWIMDNRTRAPLDDAHREKVQAVFGDWDEMDESELDVKFKTLAAKPEKFLELLQLLIMGATDQHKMGMRCKNGNESLDDVARIVGKFKPMFHDSRWGEKLAKGLTVFKPAKPDVDARIVALYHKPKPAKDAKSISQKGGKK